MGASQNHNSQCSPMTVGVTKHIRNEEWYDQKYIEILDKKTKQD